MKIKALVPFSNGTISMEQYEVREVTDSLGNELISAGVAVEIGGGSGGGVLVVTDTDGTLDKTWQEIYDAMLTGGAVVKIYDDARVVVNAYEGRGTYEIALAGAGILGKTYVADSASGYPTAAM